MNQDFYGWYGSMIGYDEMAQQFGFKDYDEMCEWEAQRLGYSSFAELTEEVDEEQGEIGEQMYQTWLREGNQ